MSVMSQESADDRTGGGDDTPRLLALPEDILIRILRFLGPRDIVTIGAVCKRFSASAAEEGLIWAPICASIVGSEAATSAETWGFPSFQRLYSRLLRLYGGLLSGPWRGHSGPLGSLLLAFPAPPYIIGAVVVSLRLAESGVSVVPVFRIAYDAAQDSVIVTCLRGQNSFQALLRRVRPFLAAEDDNDNGEGLPDDEAAHVAELQLTYSDGPATGDQSRATLLPQPELQLGARRTLSDGITGTEDTMPVGSVSTVTNDGPETALGSASSAQDMATSATSTNTGRGMSAGWNRAAHRNPTFCCGPGGPQLTHFSFSCSQLCRHQEVEAVCRWAPAATTVLAVADTTPGGAGTARIHGDDVPAGSASADGGGSRVFGGRGAPGGGAATVLQGGDMFVDLDVLAAYGLHERVHRVAMALHCLAFRNLAVPVSYSRLDGGDLAAIATAPGAYPAAGAAAAAAATSSPTQGTSTHGTGAAVVTATSGTAAVAAPASAVATLTLGAAGEGGDRVPRNLTPAAVHPLLGLWRGTYGAHGIEFVVVRMAGLQLLEGRKLTGDDNVPAGEASFRIFLDRPGPHAAHRGAPFQLPQDYVSRAVVSGLDGRVGPRGVRGLDANGDYVRARTAAHDVARVLDAFEAQGQVAGSGFDEPSWIIAEAIVLGNYTFGVLWHDIRSFSAFRRVKLPPHTGFPR